MIQLAYLYLPTKHGSDSGIHLLPDTLNLPDNYTRKRESNGLTPLLSLLLKGRGHSDSLNQTTAFTLCTISTMKPRSSLWYIDEQEGSDFNS